MEQGARSAHHILDVRLPEAMQKAIAQLPAPREQQALQGVRQRIADDVRKEALALPERRFLPQSIPFYAATEAFNYFRLQFPDYSYKEAALNPTNPRDRTSDWEADIVDMFRNNSSQKEFVGRRDTAVGAALYVSTPIRVDDESCLTCHGAAENAPPELVKLYGAGNGFGWRLHDVVGAQVVSIPAHVAENRAVSAQKSMMAWLGGVFAALWALINIVVFVFHKQKEFAAVDQPTPASG